MEPHQGDDKPHLPSPSIWPVGFAVGIACMLAGIVISTPAVIVGAVIALFFGALWARDAMRPARAPEPTAADERAAAAMAEPGAEPEEVNRFPRNQFLELTTLALGGVITAVVALPVVGFAVLPAFTNQKREGVDLGPTDNFPENEWVEATFLLDPSVGEVSRRTAFVRYNGVFEGLPSYTLISNRCVHLGCPVQAAGPRREDARKTVESEQAEIALTPILPAAYSCPCHGGAYDTEGNRTAGPPVRAMDRFRFAIDDNRLILLEPFAVAKVEGEGAQAKLEAYGIQGPGEHVDGLEGWLYPIQPQDLR